MKLSIVWKGPFQKGLKIWLQILKLIFRLKKIKIKINQNLIIFKALIPRFANFKNPPMSQRRVYLNFCEERAARWLVKPPLTLFFLLSRIDQKIEQKKNLSIHKIFLKMSKKSQASILSFFNKKSTIKSTTPKKEKQAKDDRENEENTTPIKTVVKNEPKKSASKKHKIENTSKKIENELPKPQIESDSEDDVPKRSKRKRAVIESGILKYIFLSLKDS